MKNMFLPLVCLGLILFSGAAFAATPDLTTPVTPAPATPAPQCQVTVATIAAAAQPVSHQVIIDPFSVNGMAPAPIFKSVIGDCCPGNDYHNCPDLPGYIKHCGSPQCETGEFSCLYLPR
ncbi:MAG: hypothetical protein DMF53_26980 [Acidobacteria bacterium]|nr:MAG: hypothetical protein DMF53_26980 [Acidobacteriota bacterium]